MKLSEQIKQLQDLLKEHGDLDIVEENILEYSSETSGHTVYEKRNENNYKVVEFWKENENKYIPEEYEYQITSSAHKVKVLLEDKPRISNVKLV